MDSKLTSLKFGKFGILCAALAVSLSACSSEESTPATTPADTGTVAADTGGTTTDSGGGTTDASSDDTGGTVDDTGGTTADAAPVASCETYCTTVTSSCQTLAREQYNDKTTCLKMCAKMTPGTAADTSGDTLGCRNHYAELAKTAPDANCAAAGAYGGEKCATRCEAFCKLAIAQCGTVAGASYTTEAACKTACANMPFDATKTELEQVQGKLNCTQYHLQAAYGVPNTHCGHLNITAGPCKP